jgi:adenosylhomocysteine nucleosidase
MTRIAIIAAFHREVAPLLQSRELDWQRDGESHPKNVVVWTSSNAVVAYAGMGESRAALAVEAALSVGPLDEFISVGWAGACVPDVSVGSIFRPSIVVNAQTGEQIPCVDGDRSVLATVAAFADQTEKNRLYATYGASAVDMEAATVARLATTHELRFSAIKAISDAEDFELPGIEQFHTDDGQFREAAFGFHVAFRPRLWKPVNHLAKSSKLAVGNLCAQIELLIQQHREKQE